MAINNTPKPIVDPNSRLGNTGGAASQPRNSRGGVSNGIGAAAAPSPQDNTHPGMLSAAGQRQATPYQQTTRGILGSMLASDSPYLQQARLAANRQMQARGLRSSSLAAGASQAAAIGAAAPIAAQDAQIYGADRRQLSQQDWQSQQAEIQRRFGAEQATIDRSHATAERFGRQDFAETQRRAMEKFQRGERLSQNEFMALQADQQRQFLAGESALDRSWRTGEREGAQQWNTSERIGSQDHQANQAELQRGFVAAEAALNRAFQGNQAALGRELARDLAQLQVDANKYAVDSQFSAQIFASAYDTIGQMASTGQLTPGQLENFVRGQITMARQTIELYRTI